MRTWKNLKKRSLALFIVLTMCLGLFQGVGTVTVNAAEQITGIVAVGFPRDSWNATGNWNITPVYNLMNGWQHKSTKMELMGKNDWGDMQIVYCIEPNYTNSGSGVGGNNYTDTWPWDNPQNGLQGIEMSNIIGRILQYGYQGNVSTVNSTTNIENIAKAYATQILIWETVVGERDKDFKHTSNEPGNDMMDIIPKDHVLRQKIVDYYNQIQEKVYKHAQLPSFCYDTTIQYLSWTPINTTAQKTDYYATLKDTNGVLESYDFTAKGFRFEKNGDILTIKTTSQVLPTDTITITAQKATENIRKSLVVWSDGRKSGKQDVVTYGASPKAESIVGSVKVGVLCDLIIKKNLDGASVDPDYEWEFSIQLTYNVPYKVDTASERDCLKS